MDQNEHQEIENGRGTLYGFFSALFQKPLTSGELGRILDEQAASALQSLFHGCGAETALRELRQRLEEPATYMEELLMDYEALFRVPGKPFVHPYESAYRTSMAVNDAKTRHVMDVSFTKEVMNLYESEGLETAPGFDESADHLATELEYMSHLCRIRAAHLGQGDQEAARVYEERQNAFLREHIACWAEPCLKKVEENASTPFYRIFAGFLRSFLEEERRREERRT